MPRSVNYDDAPPDISKMGYLVDRYGNPVLSGDGTPVRAGTKSEIKPDVNVPVDMNSGVSRRDAGREVNMGAGMGRRDAGREVDMNAGVGQRDAGREIDMNAGMGRRDADRSVDMNAGMGRRYAGDSEITPNAMGVPDTEVYKRSERDDFQNVPARATVAKPAPPIVTKEQLAASGLSLRDYLNKQKNLTSREGTKNPPPGSSNAPSRVLMPNIQGQPGGSIPSSGAVKFKGKDGKPYVARSLVNQGRGVDLYGDSLASLLKKNPNKKSFFEANDERIQGLKRGGTVKKMASGGSVSSASSRADGIAQRGKTKGKMC